MKNINHLSLLLVMFISASCVSVAPPDVMARVEQDLAGVPTCIEMFRAVPADCKANPSYCLDVDFFNKNIVSYQEGAQTANAVFAVSRYEETNFVALCNWNRAGTLRGWKYIESNVLAACEKSRLTFMSKNNTSLKSCEIYARGNEIQ